MSNDVDSGIRELCEFVESSSQTPSARITLTVTRLGRVRTRLAAIKLLSWLKQQGRLARPVCIEVTPDRQWCTDLLQLVGDLGLVDEVLTVRDGSVDLSPALTDAERAKLLAAVDAGYRPPLREASWRELS